VEFSKGGRGKSRDELKAVAKPSEEPGQGPSKERSSKPDESPEVKPGSGKTYGSDALVNCIGKEQT